MRWLRARRSRLDGDRFSDPLAELDAALGKPERHTEALLAAADAPESPEYRRAAAAMEGWPARLWFALDGARLDAWAWYGDEVAPRGGWPATLRRADAPTLLVILGSTHRDGFVRERAVRTLSQRPCPLASAALALRAVDHVPQVRDLARQALGVRQDAGDARVVVPILLAARQRGAATGAFDAYVEGLSEEAQRSLAGSGDNEVRRFAVEQAPLTASELVAIAGSDRDVRARLGAARRALAQDGAVAGDLLAVRPATVRALAVSVAADELVRPLLERLLLDPSAQLRRAAQARAVTLGVDAAAVYRSRLPMRAAVLGLGETGSDADVDRVMALLDAGQRAPARRAAVRALGRLAPRDLLLSLLPPLLESAQPSVARETGRQLRRLRFTLAGEPLARALGSPYAWTRQAALGIALGRRGWDLPVAALALYDDEEESLREYARSTLGDWLSRKASSAGVPSAEQTERLRASVDRLALAPGLERLVRFHAGL